MVKWLREVHDRRPDTLLKKKGMVVLEGSLTTESENSQLLTD
jgi:hypothetical protein